MKIKNLFKSLWPVLLVGALLGLLASLTITQPAKAQPPTALDFVMFDTGTNANATPLAANSHANFAVGQFHDLSITPAQAVSWVPPTVTFMLTGTNSSSSGLVTFAFSSGTGQSVLKFDTNPSHQWLFSANLPGNATSVTITNFPPLLYMNMSAIRCQAVTNADGTYSAFCKVIVKQIN